MNILRSLLLSGVVVIGGAGTTMAQENISGALAKAYAANPQLNAARASTRAIDENVPRQMSGYRPRITASADVGYTTQDLYRSQWANDKYFPRGGGVQVDQNLWNGNRTINGVRQADATVLASRESLRATEQTVLNDAATAYMDVLRDTAILNLRKNNIDVLEEQLRQTRDRFNVGEVTRTDVAQAEARLAQANSDASAAAGNLKASIGRYRAVVGAEPRQLAPAKALDTILPRSLDAAIVVGLAEHPTILSALHTVDAAELNVKVIEGELYPTVGLRAAATKRWDFQASNVEQNQAAVLGTVSVPIYEGGETYARVRQAKETLAQRRIEADQARETVRSQVVTAWAALESTIQQIAASQAQIQASETALNGVREEAKVGQRTTLDVLNAQQELLSARVQLVTAQRNRVVASYALLGAIGRLSARQLALRVDEYEPKVHYEQVRDKWIGLRTPDGR
ncbi:TolC family outer membrane protein [Alsobacter sp. R-9]